MSKWLSIALLVFLPAVLAAQDLIAPQQREPTDDAAPTSGVYVQDSATALDRIALAQRMENLKEWGKSAEIYQEIIDKFSDRVVPSHLDDNGAVDQYSSVMALVNQRLRTWPAEGLAVYRNRYELTAQNLLRTAVGDNLAPLHEVFARYFVTDSGKQAGLRLIDAYFELGDFPAATWIGQALLAHPNIEAERAGVLFRVGLAAHLCGEEKLAESALNELNVHYAGIIGAIGGRDVNLAGELAADLANMAVDRAASSAQSADDSWPTVGGDASRGKISSSTARPGARLYSVGLTPPNWRIVPDISQRKVLQQQYDQWRGDGKVLGIQPSADRGELFFQDNARVYALNIETGQPLPGWLATYPAHDGQYVLGVDASAAAISPPAGYELTQTLTDTSVLAVMGLPDTLAAVYSQAFNMAGQDSGKLVCLDRATGKENWILSARDLPDANLKTLHFGGAPLVAGSNVYLAGINNKGNGYEDSYVVCFDLATGKFRWSTYVAGAPMAGQTLQNPVTGYTALLHIPSHLSYAGGRIFVEAGVGAIAALDAYSGNVDWLNIYREQDDAVNPNNIPLMGMGMRGWGGGFTPNFQGASWNPPSPWAASAPIIHNGNVFVLPTDGKYLLVYDAGDGHLVKRLLKSNCCQTSDDAGDSAATEPDTLLGVIDGALIREGREDKREDLLFVATPSDVCAIRWRDYDSGHPSATVAWASAHSADPSIRGRPFLTADSVYIPTIQALYRVMIRNGEIAQAYPAQADPTASQSAWPAGEGPGSVLVCGDHVVVAGDKTVAVYTDLNVATAKLGKEIAAAPLDPNPHLHFAEVMFLANQGAEAAAALDEAMRLLAAESPNNRDVGARDRAFNDAMSFALRSSQVPGADDQTASLYDRAAALAASPGQQVSYRLARARNDRFGRMTDPAAATRLYQEILADAALRSAPASRRQIEPPGAVTSDDTAPDMVQAGAAAQQAIAVMLQTPQGAAAYQPFQDAARKKLALALKALDAGALLEIALDYPNSADEQGNSLATEAQSAAGELFEAGGQSRQAIEVWRDVYPRVSELAPRAAVLENLARNYLKLPDGLHVAAAQLATAAQIYSFATLRKPLPLPGGGSVPAGASMADAAQRVARLADRQTGRENNLPLFGLASHAEQRAYHAKYHKNPDPFIAQTTMAGGIDKLLLPDPDHSRYDRVATWTQGRGVSLYALDAAQPIGTDADVIGSPRGAAWVNGGNDLLVWTADQVVLIGGQQAQTRWKLVVQTLPELDVLSETAPQTRLNPLITEVDPRMIRRNQRQGLMPLRNRPFQARPLPEPSVTPSPLLYDDSSSDNGVEAVADLLPAGDAAVLSTTTGRVAALKLADGSIQWQMRLADHALDRVAANDDFTVVKSADDSSVQVAVLDTFNGRLLARQIFSGEEGEYPVNLSLGDDGRLAYTTPDRLVLCDLFTVIPGDASALSARQAAEVQDGKLFASMRRPDQLILAGGQVLALCGDGNLRGYSAATGQLRKFSDPSVPNLSDMVLPTDQQGDQAALRLGDRYVYAWGPSSIAAYNMQHPETNWGPPQPIGAGGSVRQLMLGRDFLLLLSQASDGIDASAPWTVSAFSRALVSDQKTESGLLVHQAPIPEPQGILSAQPVNGGLCYLAGDHTLHLLKGNTHPSQ